MKETNSFELIIENKADLEGLPEEIVAAAAEEARARGKDGKWVFTLQRPSIIPFLQYSFCRDLHERIFKAYVNRGNNNNEYDNKKIIARIITLRLEKAKILGYPTWAHYVLEENMAKTPEKVYEFLNEIWPRALEKARKEAQQLQQLIEDEGLSFKLEPWDWWYLAEKLRKKKYDLDEAMLRPYFKLENVIEGVFCWPISFMDCNSLKDGMFRFTILMSESLKFEKAMGVPLALSTQIIFLGLLRKLAPG